MPGVPSGDPPVVPHSDPRADCLPPCRPPDVILAVLPLLELLVLGFQHSHSLCQQISPALARACPLAPAAARSALCAFAQCVVYLHRAFPVATAPLRRALRLAQREPLSGQAITRRLRACSWVGVRNPKPRPATTPPSSDAAAGALALTGGVGGAAFPWVEGVFDLGGAEHRLQLSVLSRCEGLLALWQRRRRRRREGRGPRTAHSQRPGGRGLSRISLAGTVRPGKRARRTGRAA